MKGEADISVGVTEFPLVGKAFAQAPARVIGIVDKGDFIYIVARKDRGIASTADLRGRRVGTTKGTIAEFYLGRLLALNGIPQNELTIVDVPTPGGWVNDLADGKLDAIVTAQPYANAARDRLGKNALMWPVQNHQPLFALAVSHENWLNAHPKTAQKFLRSLAQAQEFLRTNPDESSGIVQQNLNLSDTYMPAVWQQNQYTLVLDQSLVAAMEDEARWMIANKLTNATQVPDFQEYIHQDSLMSVQADSVNIIR